jgi:hypothetical protein
MTALFGTLGLALVLPVLYLGVVVLAVVGVGGSKEPDPTGRRQRGVYYGAVAFVALFIMLFALVAGVTALTNRVGNHDTVTPSDSITGTTSTGTTTTSTTGDNGSIVTTSRPPLRAEPEGNLATKRAESQALASGIVFLMAGAVFLWHKRRIDGLVVEPDFPIGPSRRPVQGYIYAVCFVAALLAIVGGSTALFGVARVLAPSITGPLRTGERTAGVRELVSAGTLTLGAVALFLWHIRKPDDYDLRAALLGGPGGPDGPRGGFTPPPPPPPYAPAAPRPGPAAPAEQLDPSPFAPPEPPPPLPLEPAEPARRATKATKAAKAAKATKATKATKAVKKAPPPAPPPPPEPADSELEGGPVA